MKTVYQTRPEQIYLKDINIPEYLERDLGEMEEFTESIDKKGLINSLIVNEKDDGTINLIGGYRRLTALMKLRHEKAPCKVYNVSDETARLLSMHDNLHRKDFTSKELADIYVGLVKEYEGDVDEVAKLLNRKPAEIRRAISIQNLRGEILELTKGILDKRTRDTVEQLLPTLANADSQKAAIQIIKDRNSDEFDAKKIIRAIRENPKEDPLEAVDREFSEPKLVGLQVKLSIKVNKALARAGLEREEPKHVVAEKYIERCLREEGHLQ